MRNQIFTKESMTALEGGCSLREFADYVIDKCAQDKNGFYHVGVIHFNRDFYEESYRDQDAGRERPWVVHLVEWMNQLARQCHPQSLVIKLHGMLSRQIGDETEVIQVMIERHRHTVVTACAPTYHIRATEYDIKVSSPDQQQPYEYWRPYSIDGQVKWCCESSWIKTPHIVTGGAVAPALIEHYIRQLAKLFQNTYAAVDPNKRTTIPVSELKGWRMRRGDVSFSQEWLSINNHNPEISPELSAIWVEAHESIRHLMHHRNEPCTREDVDKVYSHTLTRLEKEIFRNAVSKGK